MFYRQAGQVLVLSREKLAGGARHFGVQIPDGRVADCCYPLGIRLVSLDEFTQGRDIKIEQVRSMAAWPAIAARLGEALAEKRPYHGTSWNCEVFANWLIGEPAVSKQVVVALMVAAAGVLVLIHSPRGALAALR